MLPNKSQIVGFVEGNAETLPFPDNSFDIYTIAFGLRNVTNKDVSKTILQCLAFIGMFYQRIVEQDRNNIRIPRIPYSKKSVFQEFRVNHMIDENTQDPTKYCITDKLL